MSEYFMDICAKKFTFDIGVLIVLSYYHEYPYPGPRFRLLFVLENIRESKYTVFDSVCGLF
jgi:hypothetical protein